MTASAFAASSARAGLALALFAFAGCPGPAPQREEATPAPTPPPLPTPPPPPYVPARKTETGKIFNGMQYRVTLETELGSSATAERNDPDSYRAELIFKVKVPKPHKSLEEISRLNSELPKILPALPAMLEAAKISPHFDDLYRLKVSALRTSLNRLEGLLTRHNFFDCETILELQHPQSRRRALLLQGDMDVDTDGSDSDRVPVIEGASSTFQPFTSYRWAKKTDTPSAFLAAREAKLKELEQELAAGLATPRKEQIKSALADLKSQIADLKNFSFLVGQADPFIVLPGSMFGKSRSGGFAPGVGDYCVVIFERKFYPAIVGDVGPANLMGEASLRLCKQILPQANASFRAVSDLKVTYLVFPGSAERPFAAPDLAKWAAKCAKLLEEIGGHQGELFAWEDLTKPKPAPAAPSTPADAPVPITPPAAPAPGLLSPPTAG